MKHSKTHQAIRILGSSGFFWFTLVFFVLQALWLVFSAVYPMAFDENFHFGIIKIYSHHVLPFLTQQPAGANPYGPVVHDPSYFYQYLMSFPYRIIALFTKDQTIQIIFLRIINVALFAAALVVFRKVLLRAKVSSALTNVSILLFILIPVVPLLAAEINYDNLVILFVAWNCLVMERIVTGIQTKRIPLKELALLLVLGLLGSIVKYAFLPIFAASVLIVLVLLWWTFRGRSRSSAQSFWKTLIKSYRQFSRLTRIAILGAVVISLGLFSQRYVVNLASYKSAIPRCDKVLSTDACMSYGPFARNYVDAEYKNHDFKIQPLHYISAWFYGTWFRLFFAINGDVVTPATATYETISPLPLPSIPAIVIVSGGLLTVILLWRKLFRNDWILIFFATLELFYIAALFIDDYIGYIYTGQPVAINGRYLIPALLPGIAIMARALQLALKRWPRLKLSLAGVAIVLFLQGGGILPFMLSSNHNWFWPNHTVVSVNKTAKDVAEKIVFFDQPLRINSP
ncbi:MAG TPA: hypothetical protein VMR28_01120 [Candidatus Saccharimonadales bacterium]|nr:hypothetical protein [Candidatus Saccharimonadales bacterium]